MLKKLSIAINMKNIFNKTAKECSSSIEIVKLLENFEIQKKNKENNHIVVIKNVKAEQFLNIFKKVSPSQKDIKDSIKTIKNPVSFIF